MSFCEDRDELLQHTVWSNGEISDVERQIIEERNAAVRQLERDISDLVDVSNDIACLVNAQGEDLDLAASNTVSAETNMHVATESLHSAVSAVGVARRWIVGVGVTSAVVTVAGAGLAFVSLPVGLATVGIGLVGVIVAGVSQKRT